VRSSGFFFINLKKLLKMKKFHKAVKEYLKFKNKLNCKNTNLVFDPGINDYIVFINWSKEYLTNNYHFINVY